MRVYIHTYESTYEYIRHLYMYIQHVYTTCCCCYCPECEPTKPPLRRAQLANLQPWLFETIAGEATAKTPLYRQHLACSEKYEPTAKLQRGSPAGFLRRFPSRKPNMWYSML